MKAIAAGGRAFFRGCEWIRAYVLPMGCRLLGTIVVAVLLTGMELALSQVHFDTYQEANSLRKAGKLQEALAGFEKALQQAKAGKDRRWIFYSAYRIGYVQSDLGNGDQACEAYANSLHSALDPTSGDVVRALRRDRGDVLTCGLALKKLLTNRGLLTDAFRTQDRLVRLTNRWIESIASKRFDCLIDTPPIGLSGKPLAFVWRMRTAQSALWDLTGRTVEATNLLRRTLAASPAPKAGTREDSEWQRTRQNLAVMLDFLGYRREALSAYTKLMLDRPGSRNAAYARFNRARLSSKIEGPSEEWLEQAKRGRSEVAKHGTSTRELGKLDRILAAMEADLGNAKEARQRLEALENAAAARGDALIQLYIRRELLLQLDDEESSMPEGNQEAALLEMLQSYRSRGIRRGEPSVYRLYARFLASEGRLPEAIAMVRQAAHLSEQFGWHLHLPRLWVMSANWHSELGQESEATALWKRIDGLLGAHADFPEKRRLEVLLAKMQWLASHRKMAEAKVVYEQAAKLVAASSLTAFQVEAFKALDLKALFRLDDDETGAGAVKPVAWADLQPLAVRSVALPGFNASAVYLLSNPGVLPVSGRLTATGPIESSTWQEEKGEWVIALKDQAGKSSVRSPVITCEPGQSVSVSLEHAATVEGGLATCELGWQPAVNGKTEGNRVSQWDFGGRTEDGVRVHAALASVTRRNAFYAVPVPQFVQSLATLGQDSQPQNYRLKASSPCWIELSNAADEVLGIDANGNGLFEDAGDVLEADRDANGFPDVALDASRNSQELIIFNVYPSAATSDEPIRLEFQLLSGSGDWETVSISQLK